MTYKNAGSNFNFIYIDNNVIHYYITLVTILVLFVVSWLLESESISELSEKIEDTSESRSELSAEISDNKSVAEVVFSELPWSATELSIVIGKLAD